MKLLAPYLNNVTQGDCLEVMKNFPDRSINMVLCDLPYGISINPWDEIIDLAKLWVQYERIIKPGGVIVLTSAGLFTAQLILSNTKLYKYKIVWIKSKSTNFLNCNKQPLRRHEDICVFYRRQPPYQPQMSPGAPYNKGWRPDHFTGCYGKYKPSLCLSTGLRYPTDVVFFDEASADDWFYCTTSEHELSVYHPTQKPVELGRYLVRTFTRPGDIVLDNACGSGSFLVAANQEQRQFIGIEKNQKVYYKKSIPIDLIKIARERLNL